MKPSPIVLPVLLACALAVLTGCNRSVPDDDTAKPAADAAPAAATTPTPDPYANTPAPDADVPAATTSADGNDTSAGLTFEQMDKNQDGGITPDELSSTEMLYEHFAAADADGNAQLSADEIVTHRANMAASGQ